MTDEQKVAYVNRKLFECMVFYSEYWKGIWDRQRIDALAYMSDKHKVMMYDRHICYADNSLPTWVIDFADYSYDVYRTDFNENEYFATLKKEIDNESRTVSQN